MTAPAKTAQFQCYVARGLKTPDTVQLFFGSLPPHTEDSGETWALHPQEDPGELVDSLPYPTFRRYFGQSLPPGGAVILRIMTQVPEIV